MIIAIVSVLIRPGLTASALALCHSHAELVRAADGCLEHRIQQDAELPQRLVMLEKWQDHALLNDYIASAAAEQFGKALTALSAGPPNIELFDAQAVDLY